jgi:hypothetical protein
MNHRGHRGHRGEEEIGNFGAGRELEEIICCSKVACRLWVWLRRLPIVVRENKCLRFAEFLIVLVLAEFEGF